MTPTSVTLAWAIKAPDGSIILKTLSEYSELNAWCFFTGGEKKNHERVKKEGYRCVRVRVEEIKE